MLWQRLRIWFVLTAYLLVAAAQFHHLLDHGLDADDLVAAVASDGPPSIECGGGACGMPGHHHHERDPRPLHDHTNCQICSSMLIAPARTVPFVPAHLERSGVARPDVALEAAGPTSITHLGPRGPPSILA
jgi:hypothetical protein